MSKPALLDSISPGYKQLVAALVSAGLDPAAVLAAPASLKSHIDQAVASASASVDVAAAVTAATAEMQERLTAAEQRIAAEASTRALFDAQLASIGFKAPAVQGKDGAAPTIEESVVAFQQAYKAHLASGVTQQVQEIGFPVGKLPAATHDDASKELSYAEFSKLSAAAKMDFCKRGGRLTSAPATSSRN